MVSKVVAPFRQAQTTTLGRLPGAPLPLFRASSPATYQRS